MTDRQIDTLVYELYELCGLTAEEIKVVEGKGPGSWKDREPRRTRNAHLQNWRSR